MFREGGNGTHDQLRAALTEALLPFLLGTPVLNLLSKHQRSLDVHGIESLDPSEQPSTNPTVADWTSFLDTYTSNSCAVSPGLGCLLSATFKDCSVIVRMDLLDHDPHTTRAQINPSKISIIDLDVKSASKFPKWRAMDKEITDAYADVPLDDRRICVDAGMHG